MDLGREGVRFDCYYMELLHGDLGIHHPDKQLPPAVKTSKDVKLGLFCLRSKNMKAELFNVYTIRASALGTS